MGWIDPFVLVMPIVRIGWWGNPYGLGSEEWSIHLLQTNGNVRSVVVTSSGGIGRMNLIGF